MTFFCVNCFAELSADGGSCARCGAPQNLDHRDYPAKLRRALAHPLAETRRRAIFLLGEKRVVDAVRELVEILDDESDPLLAEEAAAALGKIHNRKAMTALVRAARHRSFLVRARAIRALVDAGGIWKKTASELAERDPSAMVRQAARDRKDRGR